MFLELEVERAELFFWDVCSDCYCNFIVCGVSS